MVFLKKYGLVELIDQLPEINEIDYDSNFLTEDDFFICSLGFEDRNTNIPQKIFEKLDYRAKKAIVFLYNTNVEENEKNKEELFYYLNGFTQEGITSINSDNSDFSDKLRQTFNDEIKFKAEKKLNISIDISTCGSKIILYFFKIALEFDISLNILYTEAEKYYPTKEEAQKLLDCGPEEQIVHPTQGISKVYTSQEHPGESDKLLKDLLILFATFTPERTKKVVSFVNEDLLRIENQTENNQIIWIIGKPKSPENQWRAEYVKNINQIPEDKELFTISTFYYLETLEQLESLYNKHYEKYHITLSPFGSKFQLIGMALFHYIRPNCTIALSTPKMYSTKKYSEGSRSEYIIKFGDLQEIRKILDKIDTIELINEDD